MKIPLEIDWVKIDKRKSTLILKHEGIFIHPYDIKEDAYLLGDAVSVSVTGVFGAFNLYKKTSNIPTLAEIARKIRNEKGIEELVKSKAITFVPWHQIISAKKNWLTANIVVRTKSGNKILIRETEIKKEREIISFLLKKIDPR